MIDGFKEFGQIKVHFLGKSERSVNIFEVVQRKTQALIQFLDIPIWKLNSDGEYAHKVSGNMEVMRAFLDQFDVKKKHFSQ